MVAAAGSLALSSVAVSAGQEIATAGLGNLTFTPAANANGVGYASFTFLVQDGEYFGILPFFLSNETKSCLVIA